MRHDSSASTLAHLVRWRALCSLPQRVPGTGRQWLLVTLIGLALGLTTLRLTGMPLQWTCLLALMVLLPCMAVMVGSVRRLCLAIILLMMSLMLPHISKALQQALSLKG